MAHTKGWILSNNEKGDIVIQKDDESNRFKNDDEATEFVVKSYAELLEALEMAVKALQDNNIDEMMSGEFEIITDAINKAKGRK